MNLVRTVKDNKKAFYNNIGLKSKTRENAEPLLNEAGEMMKMDMEKAKVLDNFFISVFTDRICLQEYQDPETCG